MLTHTFNDSEAGRMVAFEDCQAAAGAWPSWHLAEAGERSLPDAVVGTVVGKVAGKMVAVLVD